MHGICNADPTLYLIALCYVLHISFDHSTGSGSSNKEASVLKCANKLRPGAWNFDEDGLFNLDEEGRAEKQLCAVAASNIIRNFSNMPDNEVIMAQHRHCFETIFQCLEDYVTGGKRGLNLILVFLCLV